jgi:alkanesulfonate monooxygenase SsuD/methylene tetrahydromethanopterin reductase-like flavin-dependent oxidoreductase (luciferase family)
MLASFFVTAPYRGPGRAGWPRPPGIYQRDIGLTSFRECIEELEYADELGFDWVSISEHHYGFSMCGIPTVMAMHMANHVKRAKVAVLGPTLPLNNPVRVAEELALLDNLCEGRLVVGLLRGTPNEYQVYSVNPEETRPITTEAMELILKAWTEPEPFAWVGRHFNFRSIAVWPRTLQEPMPPTYALGNSAETCEFAASHHLGLGVSFGTFAGNGRSTSYYRERCQAYGWQPKPEQIIYRARVLIAETDAEARDMLPTQGASSGESYLRYQASVQQTVKELDPNPFHTGGGPIPGREDYRPPEGAGGMGPSFIGSPSTVIDQVIEARDEIGAGVIDFMFYGNLGLAENKRQMKLFADKVLPEVRNL